MAGGCHLHRGLAALRDGAPTAGIRIASALRAGNRGGLPGAELRGAPAQPRTADRQRAVRAVGLRPRAQAALTAGPLWRLLITRSAGSSISLVNLPIGLAASGSLGVIDGENAVMAERESMCGECLRLPRADDGGWIVEAARSDGPLLVLAAFRRSRARGRGRRVVSSCGKIVRSSSIAALRVGQSASR